MSAPHPSAPVVPPSGEGWTVVVNMPLWETGKDAGKPAGWLNLNTMRKMHWSKQAKLARLWRRASYNALNRARLPQLPRVRVQLELRCQTHRRRDTAQNYWGTFKPVIDALQPTKQVPGKEPELGVGVIPEDHKDYLDLPEPREGPTLGRGFTVKGMPVNGQVIMHIYPLPPGD